MDVSKLDATDSKAYAQVQLPLKICQLCAVDFTLKHFLLPLIDGLRSASANVVCVCSPGEGVAELVERGYCIEAIPIARNFNMISHIKSLILLYKLFRRESFDVLHVHTPVAALIGRIAGRVAGIPIVIYTAHGFYFHDEMPGWKRKIFVLLERLGGYFSDFIFTQAVEDAQNAITERIVPVEKVLAIGNGVDPSRFDPEAVDDVGKIRDSLGIPRGAQVIGIIGRMVREKGYPEFFSAAKAVANQCADAYFLVIGSRLDSEREEEMGDCIKMAKIALGARLILAGFRDDTPRMLAAMDVFCLPSHREGMPRTIIEAMMMAKPVIATNIRGSREEVVPETTGWLVPTHNAIALADAMKCALMNSESAKSMGLAGRLRALSLYDEKHVVQRQLAVIDRLVRSKSCR